MEAKDGERVKHDFMLHATSAWCAMDLPGDGSEHDRLGQVSISTLPDP